MTILGTDADKSRPEEGLVIPDGIQRCHQRIHLSVIREDRHPDRRPEGTVDLVIRRFILTEHTIALTLTNRTVEDLLNLCLCQIRRIRCIGFLLVFCIESGLEVFCHMLISSLLCILLHSGIVV